MARLKVRCCERVRRLHRRRRCDVEEAQRRDGRPEPTDTDDRKKLIRRMAKWEDE